MEMRSGSPIDYLNPRIDRDLKLHKVKSLRVVMASFLDVGDLSGGVRVANRAAPTPFLFYFSNFRIKLHKSLVCPQGSKAANMKLKGKSKAFGSGSQKDEKYNELKSQVARRLDLLDDLKKDK
ncbi:hypothetical protein CRG98_035322 [Punica granatum]|uniref:Uncharacterized protein n=1 Tax=Punica granatum TaxID=22663 RepID=A0A2I0IJQ6_PUNGR|nr:hypothetical protein CRG98_035322 [Punica granatum]